MLETPCSFINAMEGAALAAKDKHDLAIVMAWHTAIFALNGYGGKLKGKSLSDFLETEAKPPSKNAAAIAFFHTLKARGFNVEISRAN